MRYLSIISFFILTVDSQAIVSVFGDPKDSSFAGHPIAFYLNHKQIPKACKDLYLQKRPPSADNDILALMDSIFTTNKQTRPFYFLTLTRTMKNSDGAYSEPLGIMSKKFVETNTKEFLNYFLNETAITNAHFDQWAKFVSYEINISAEHYEQQEIQNLKNKMLTHCSSCDQRQKKKLDDFIQRIESHNH